MKWAALAYRGEFLSIPRSGNFQVFGKSRTEKILTSYDLVKGSARNIFNGAPVLDGDTQVHRGTIDPYEDPNSTDPNLPVLSVKPTISPQMLARIPDGFTNTPPSIDAGTNIKVVIGSLHPLRGLIVTTGRITESNIQSLPYPNFGNPNRPAYLAEFDALLTDAAHGARVLLDDDSLLGMLYLTPADRTLNRIFPAHLL